MSEQFTKGQKVKCLWDTGAFGASFLGGVVVTCGPKTYTVRWESGFTNRLKHGDKRVTDRDWLTPEEVATGPSLQCADCEHERSFHVLPRVKHPTSCGHPNCDCLRFAVEVTDAK